jgi:energy-coupling factor transporter ATP-binding protein EcfA2
VTGRPEAVEAVARTVVAATLAAPPTLGPGRLVCVDGPAGSGKTTLAAAVARQLADALRSPGSPAGPAPVRQLHMDDLYDGWAGLEAGMATLAQDVVGPLRTAEAGRHRRYDWHRGGFAEERLVPPVEVLLVEGVGAGAAAIADVVTVLVWVETPPDVRSARWLARDGEQMREHWDDWRARESAVHARERTRQRADLVVDGVTGVLVRGTAVR